MYPASRKTGRRTRQPPGRQTDRLGGESGRQASQGQWPLRQYLDGRGEEGRGLIHSFLFPARLSGQHDPSSPLAHSPSASSLVSPPLPRLRLPPFLSFPFPPCLASSLSWLLPIPKLFSAAPPFRPHVCRSYSCSLLSRPVISLSIAVIVIVIDYSVTSVASQLLVFLPAYLIYPPPLRSPPPKGRKDKRRAKENIICWKLQEPRLADAAQALLLYETFMFVVIVMLRYVILLGHTVTLTCLFKDFSLFLCTCVCAFARVVSPDTLLGALTSWKCLEVRRALVHGAITQAGGRPQMVRRTASPSSPNTLRGPAVYIWTAVPRGVSSHRVHVMNHSS